MRKKVRQFGHTSGGVPRAARCARSTAAVVAGALLLTLSACGGDDDSGDGSGGDTSAAAVPTTVQLPKLNGAKLQVTAVWTGTEQENFQKVLDEFEKRTGARVTYVPGQDPLINYVGSKIAGGAPPDVAMMPQVGAIKQAVEKKWAKPVGPEAMAQLKKNYAPAWAEIGQVDGEQYGVYFKAANKSLIWYNTKVFENAAVKEPKTWQEFLTTSQTVYDSGVPPMSIGGADGWVLTDWFENIYLSQAGPEKYDQLAQHKIKWTDPSVTKALTTLGAYWGKKGYLAGGANGTLQTAFPDSVKQTFTGGDQPDAGMVFEADFVGVNVQDAKAEVGKDAKIFPFPAVGDQPPVVSGGEAAVILKDSKASQALLTFLASPDAAAVWAKEGGYLSPNKNVPPEAYPNEEQRTMAKALIDAGNDFRYDMSDQAPQSFGGTPGKGEWKILQDFLKNPKDVKGAQAKLEAEATKAYGG